EARLAFDEQDGHAELHAELGLQLVFRPMVDQCVRHVVIGAHRYALDALGTDVVTLHEIEHHAHARMREGAAGMRLDGYARKRERPRVAELALDHLRAVAATGRAEEPAIGFDTDR